MGKKRAKKPAKVRRCSICGCSENEPCPGGCGWIAADRCDSCGIVAHKAIELELPAWLKVELREAADAAGMTLQQLITKCLVEQSEGGFDA